MDYTNSNPLVERKPISVFDTTLRDGEQSALCTMYLRDKLKIAEKLEEIGADVIEAGFAGSNRQNFETIQEICKVVRRPYVCSLARCKGEDIESAYESMKDYSRRMIHLFMPTSEVQVFDKMKKDYDTIEKMILESVRIAKGLFRRVELSCEDATRTPLEVLKRIYGMAVSEGVNVVNIPDTAGVSYPEEFGRLVKQITEFVKSINPEVITSVHCHNDLDLATINSLYGISNGAKQVECTINGIGERAGNCKLEVIVAHEIFKGKFNTRLRGELIWRISQMVSKATETRNDFAPVTGTCAFSHKAGIHQHGVIANSKTYEGAVHAGSVGRETEIVLGPHSGYHGVHEKAKKLLGIEVTREQAQRVIDIITEEVSQEKKRVFSDEYAKKIVLKTLQDSIN